MERYCVATEVRKHGSLGVFTWRITEQRAESMQNAALLGMREAHAAGYETRGHQTGRYDLWFDAHGRPTKEFPILLTEQTWVVK